MRSGMLLARTGERGGVALRRRAKPRVALCALRAPGQRTVEGSEGAAVARHMPLVRQVVQQAHGVLPSSIEHDEVLSWGVAGLLDALRKFDADAGTSFSTYARIRIRGSILDQLRGLDWASRTTRQKANHLRRSTQELEHRLGRPAAPEEIASAMDLSLEKYHALRTEVGDLRLLSLEEISFGRATENLSYEEFVPSPTADPLSMLLARERKDAVSRAIESLPGKERLVMPLYYRSEMTMKEVGQRLGITESRVSQLHSKALVHLRNLLERQAPEITPS